MRQTARPISARAPGFTLVELTVALALGAMLMVAIVGILQSMSRELEFAKHEADQDWQSSVKRLLHQDLLCASQISTAGGWYWLDGSFTAADSKSGTLRKVGYRCVPGILDGESVLMRVADRHGEPVLFGPTKMHIERVDSRGVAQPLSAQPTAVPRYVRVWIWMPDDEDTAASFQHDFLLH
ncbi:MAG: prepilin-type N-terminal cleavage/methylation domain-containing protein [Pirellulaceae bacterium]